MAKQSHGYNRTVKRTIRLSQSEDRALVERTKRSGAKTPSAHLRYAALHGLEAEVPAWEHLRALINAMVQCTMDLRKAGCSKAVEEKAIDAFDRISRI